GDRYAGLTFAAQFNAQGVPYEVARKTTSDLFEALEPRINSRLVVLPDVPVLEQQLLGLVWRGGKITHQPGEHDDYATAAAGAIAVVPARAPGSPELITALLEAGSEPHLIVRQPEMF